MTDMTDAQLHSRSVGHSVVHLFVCLLPPYSSPLSLLCPLLPAPIPSTHSFYIPCCSSPCYSIRSIVFNFWLLSFAAYLHRTEQQLLDSLTSFLPSVAFTTVARFMQMSQQTHTHTHSRTHLHTFRPANIYQVRLGRHHAKQTVEAATGNALMQYAAGNLVYFNRCLTSKLQFPQDASHVCSICISTVHLSILQRDTLQCKTLSLFLLCLVCSRSELFDDEVFRVFQPGKSFNGILCKSVSLCQSLHRQIEN